MKKRNRKLVLSIGSIAAIGTTTASIVSCSVNPNAGILPDDGTDNAYTIYLKNGTAKNVNYNEFLDYLRNNKGTSTTVKVMFENQIVKYLYDQEQKASVTAHDKDNKIAKLDTVTKIEDDAKDTLNKRREAIQAQYGTSWEEEWNKVLLSAEFGGATSDGQAIEHIVVGKMRSSALTRFTMKIDTTTYKNDQIGKTAFPFLTSKNAIPGNGGEEGKAIALVTDSLDDKQKSPDTSLARYLEEYKVATNIRHLLYSIKAGETLGANWTITKDTLLKLFDGIGDKPVWELLPELNNAPEKWVTNPTDTNKSLAATISEFDSDDPGSSATEGSLGMKTEFDYLQQMVPGFAIPLGYDFVTDDPTIITPIAPIDVTLNLQTIAETILEKPAGSPITEDDINNMTDLDLTKFANMFRDQLTDRTDPTTQEIKPRNLKINLTNEAKTLSQDAVFSSNGLHIIYQESINNTTDPAQALNELYQWVQSDLQRTKDTETLIYDVVKEINSKLSASSNLDRIDKTFLEDQDFLIYLKTQKNYANGGDTPATFTDGDVKKVKELDQGLIDAAISGSKDEVQKTYGKWWSDNVDEGLFNNSNKSYENLMWMIYKLSMKGNEQVVKGDESNE